MNKTKVCHVTSAHSRYDTRIFYKECITLANNNYLLSLIVNDTLEKEIKNSVTIIPTNYQPKNRFQRMFISLKLIKRKVLEVDADIYHLHDPELLRIVGFLKRHNKKVIFDSHEDYPSTMIVMTWIPKFLRKVASLLYVNVEKRIINKLDGALVCYHWTKERYSKILANTELLFNFPMKNLVYSKENRYSTNTIAYAGGINQQWNHDSIIKALTITKKKYRYILAGYADPEYLKYLKSLDGWSSVDFKESLSYEKVYSDVYLVSSVGVALLDYIPQCKKTIGNLSNTKIFEYMQLRLPIICTDFDLWKDIINNEKCGIYLNPHDPIEIARALDFLSDNPQIAKMMGENGQKAVQDKYNWESDSENLLKVYRKIGEKL